MTCAITEKEIMPLAYATENWPQDHSRVTQSKTAEGALVPISLFPSGTALQVFLICYNKNLL